MKFHARAAFPCACWVLFFGGWPIRAEPPSAVVGATSQAPMATSAPAARVAAESSDSLQPVVLPDLAMLLRRIYPQGRILSQNEVGVTLRQDGREWQIDWDDLPEELRPAGRTGLSRPMPAAQSWGTPRPGYPFQARQQRITGTLVVFLGTNAEGRVAAAALWSQLHPTIDAHVLDFVREHWTGPANAHRTFELVYALTE